MHYQLPVEFYWMWVVARLVTLSHLVDTMRLDMASPTVRWWWQVAWTRAAAETPTWGISKIPSRPGRRWKACTRLGISKYWIKRIKIVQACNRLRVIWTWDRQVCPSYKMSSSAVAWLISVELALSASRSCLRIPKLASWPWPTRHLPMLIASLRVSRIPKSISTIKRSFWIKWAKLARRIRIIRLRKALSKEVSLFLAKLILKCRFLFSDYFYY